MARKTEYLYLAIFILLFCLAGNLYAGEIHEAAKTGDIEKIKSILEADKTRLEAQDKVGYTALNWAAMRAQWDVVRYLIEIGANTNTFGLDGNTPLHSAANHNYVAIVGLLIKKGSVVDKKNNWGDTPLHIACRAGNDKVAQILIFQGAKINEVSNDGWTPLYYAQKSGHTELAGLLKKSGGSLEYLDSDGKNADEIRIRRPAAIKLDRSKLEEFVGTYAIDNNFITNVWIEDDKLWVEDFAFHPLYPIGVDSFYCEKQPWTISFGRDENSKVDSIYLGYLRRTVGGVKVADDFEVIEDKPKLGLTARSMVKKEFSLITLKDIYRLDALTDTVAASVTFVLENSPADRAGLRQRDVIIMFNNDPVFNSEDLLRLVKEVEPGATGPVEILRRGNLYSLTVNFE